MDARNLRLIKLFAGHIGAVLLWMAGAAGYLAAIELLPWPWGMILAIVGAGSAISWFAWDIAKYRLERQEYAEKKLADQLVNSD